MATADEAKKAELFTYEAPWTIYALAWCQRKDKPFRLAIGSFIEEYTNKVLPFSIPFVSPLFIIIFFLFRCPPDAL